MRNDAIRNSDVGRWGTGGRHSVHGLRETLCAHSHYEVGEIFMNLGPAELCDHFTSRAKERTRDVMEKQQS